MATHTQPSPASRPARARLTAERPSATQIPRLRAPVASPSSLRSPTSPRPLSPMASPFASPLPSMLALSAATRAVAGEPTLAGALAALRRQACQLTRATAATVVLFTGARRTARTTDGPITSTEFRDIVTRVASRGRRELFDDALVEPLGAAPCPSVLALWRPAPFTSADIALCAALVGGVTATVHRLLAAA